MVASRGLSKYWRRAHSSGPSVYEKPWNAVEANQRAAILERARGSWTEYRERLKSVTGHHGEPLLPFETLLCGVEGPAGSGKTSSCRLLPLEMTSNFAGADIGPENYPPLRSDPTGRYRISLDSLWHNRRYFTAKEIARTRDIEARRQPFVALDHCWISQIVHAYCLTLILKLPDDVVRETIEDIEKMVLSGDLYFPHWLALFDINVERSYRKVIRREGRFFGRNMEEILTTEERKAFLQARAQAFRILQEVRPLPISSISYKAHPVDKLCAILIAPRRNPPNPRVFFNLFGSALLRSLSLR